MWFNIVVFLLGIALGVIFRSWLGGRVSSSGVIVVTKEEERTLFSLRLEETPEELESKKTVIFKVETPE